MPDISVKKLANEIFVRNKQSEFTRMNQKITGFAAVPQVAVFFIEETADGFRLYGKKCNMQDGRLEAGIKRYPDNHCIVWRDIQEAHLPWLKTGYLDVPRGCVMFDANNIINPRFVIILPLRYRDNRHLIELVLNTYHLLHEKVIVRYEELY